MDFGADVILTGDISFQTKESRENTDGIAFHKNDAELYLGEDGFDGFIKKSWTSKPLNTFIPFLNIGGDKESPVSMILTTISLKSAKI